MTTVPSSEQIDGHPRFRARLFRKCLAQLGYLGADATNTEIWDLVCYFREGSNLFGPRMRAYEKPVYKKMNTLMKKVKQ